MPSATFRLLFVALACLSSFACSTGPTGSQAASQKGLNGTGLVLFGDATGNNLTAEPADFPGQDASFGRDAAAARNKLAKAGSGSKGFDFTKIANDGSELPESAALGTAPKDWACTRDNVTGLIWEVKTQDGLRAQWSHYTWYDPDNTRNGGTAGTRNGGSCTGSECDTYSYVQAVNATKLCGQTDWRMPQRDELRSLEDYGKIPSYDVAFFPNTNPSTTWSASPYAGNPAFAWYVDFLDADDNPTPKNMTLPVRVVRGESLWATSSTTADTGCVGTIPASTPTADFTDNGDGTVSHSKTGLTWMRCSLGQTWSGGACTGNAASYTWQNALLAAQTLNKDGGYAKQSDWRVPNIKELNSIVENQCHSPTINKSLFPATPEGNFWSSSLYQYYWDPKSSLVWFVNFANSIDLGDGKNLRNYVRLVRGGSFSAMP